MSPENKKLAVLVVTWITYGVTSFYLLAGRFHPFLDWDEQSLYILSIFGYAHLGAWLYALTGPRGNNPNNGEDYPGTLDRLYNAMFWVITVTLGMAWGITYYKLYPYEWFYPYHLYEW